MSLSSLFSGNLKENSAPLPVANLFSTKVVSQPKVSTPVKVSQVVAPVVKPSAMDDLVKHTSSKIDDLIKMPVPVKVEKPVKEDESGVRIIEKIVKVPTKLVVEKIVEVPKEVSKEVIVEKIVEKIVEVPRDVIVEKIVEVPREIIVEKIVEVPKEVVKEVVKVVKDESALLQAHVELEQVKALNIKYLQVINQINDELMVARTGKDNKSSNDSGVSKENEKLVKENKELIGKVNELTAALLNVIEQNKRLSRALGLRQ